MSCNSGHKCSYNNAITPNTKNELLIKYFIFQIPRIYKRRTNKAAWTAETLQAALEAVNGGRALREVARAFSITRGTLQDRIKSGNRHKPQLGRRSVFSQAQENELAEQVLNLSKIFLGVTRSSIMRSAYIFASLNNIKNPFSKN